MCAFIAAAKAHPLPQFPCPVDMPDDFFRIRLVCVLLDTCGMCFDRGSQKRKLDNFLVFFQVFALPLITERIDNQVT
jgi:regulator of nonsense transcripts 2